MRPRPGTLGVWGGGRNHHLRGTSPGPECPQGCHFSSGCPSSHTCSGFAVLHPFLDSFTTLSDPPMAVEQLGRGHQRGNPIFPMEPPCLLAPPLIPERFGTGCSLPGSAPPDPAPPSVRGSQLDEQLGTARTWPARRWGRHGAVNLGGVGGQHVPGSGWPRGCGPLGGALMCRAVALQRTPRAGHRCCSLASLLAGCPPVHPEIHFWAVLLPSHCCGVMGSGSAGSPGADAPAQPAGTLWCCSPGAPNPWP